MSKKNTEQELTLLLKEVIARIKNLEATVYNEDNILMKSGLVKVDGPTPLVKLSSATLPDSESIAKMSWEEIEKLADTVRA